MPKINLSSASQKSESTIINQVFFDKLQKIKQYLAHKIGQDKEHNLFLQDLDSLIVEVLNYQPRVTIVGRREDFLKKVKLASQNCELFNSCFQCLTIALPYNLNRLLNDCDLVFLVIDSRKKIIPLEKKLVIQSRVRNIPLTIIDFNQTQSQIQSWLEQDSSSAINYVNFPNKSCEKSHLLSGQKEYDDFLQILLADTIFPREAIFEEKLKKMVNKYFMQNKIKYWEEIKQQNQSYLLGEDHNQFQEKLRQLTPKVNKILQQNFKIIKQTLQESKQELINPFVSTSFIYNVQQLINDSTVVQLRENKEIYLNLVVIEEQHRKAIHRKVLELYQQRIDLWIEEQWQLLDQELNIFNELREIGDRELKFLHGVSEVEIDLPIISQPVFNLDKYICPTTLSEINRTIFDYHYSQSAWFRIGIAIVVGAVFFLVTDRLFGFIFLVFQIVNLLTGQSTKSIKLKQQTKELKRIVDHKYQNLVKFIADKLIQDINVFLDKQLQLYQDIVNSYIQESNRNLATIKQKNTFNQNKIRELNQDQQNIMQIINDSLSNK